MARREFPASVKKAVIKRATKASVVYCEACSLPAKKWQIDHVIADSHGGKPVIENAELICEICFSIKNPKDTTIAAQLKRIEAKHIGATKPKGDIPAPAPRPKEPKASKIMPGKAPVTNQSALYRAWCKGQDASR